MAGTGKPLGKMIIEMDLNSAKLTSSLTAVKRSLKASESQMKAQMAIFDRADNRLGKLGAQYAGLDRSLQLNKKHTENLTRAYKDEIAVHGETSVKAQNLARDINNSVAKQAVLEKQLKATGRAMDIEKLNINELNGKMQAQGRLSAALAESQALAGNKIGAARAQYAGLSQKVATLTQLRGLEQQKLELLAGAQGKASQAYLNQKARIQELDNEMLSSQNSMRAYAKQIGNIPPQFDRFRNSMDLTSQKLKTLGSQTFDIGKKMSFISVPLGIGLYAATKSAVTFSSEIQKMSALLDDGTVSGNELKQQLSGLGDASKKWSKQYGISTTAINDGMEEIIKKGYTYNQTLGAMPSIMDASVASGEDFNVVMNNSTSILEQFGLKVADTQGTLKNTQRVTDSLTFVANKTAAGFADMGLAMEYVGPVAHSAEISLEQTSAAIGLMSNNGIEGEKAGTALRGALTRLLKPSKQNIEGFHKLGISSKAFRDGTLDLPTLLDKIKNNTKGWTGAQRASAIALAFGTEAQTGMNVLVNQGGDALRGLTEDTKNATGYTKELAKSMGDTPARKIAKFKESLHVLAIEFGDKVLPAITPLVEEGTELIQKFSELDDQTQKNIVKWTLLAAAAGPVTMGLGAVTKGAGALIGVGSKLTTGLGNIMLQSRNAKTGMTAVSSGAKLATAGMGAATEGASLFGLALSPLGVGILGVGAVLAGGYAAWKIWGEKAYESAERTKRWGTDVGAEADKSLTKFQNFQTEATTSLDLFAKGATDDSTKVVTAFKNMAKEIKSNTDESFNDFSESFNNYSASVQGILKGEYDNQKKEAGKRKADVAAQVKEVESIYKNAASNHRNLTSEESKTVNSIYKAMQEEEIESLNISGKKKKQLLNALNGDVKSLSQKTLTEQNDYFAKSTLEFQKKYDKQEKDLKASYKAGRYTKSKYNEALRQMDRERNTESFASASAWVETQRQIYKNLGTNTKDAEANIKKGLEDMGLDYEEFTRQVQESAGKVSDASTLIGDGASKADIAWSNIVLDEKTGRVRTNLPEVINEASQSEAGWKNLKFIMKEAKLTTDAKATIATALIQNGKWESMTYSEKKMVVSYPGALSAETALRDMGQWDKLTPQQKSLIANAKTGIGLKTALMEMGQWNQLPVAIKDLLADNSDITKKLNEGKSFIVDYNGKKVELKKLLSNNSDLVNKIKNGKDVILNYNGERINLKYLFGNNLDLLKKMSSGKKTISDYNRNFTPYKKSLLLETSSLNGVKGKINEIDNAWTGFRPHGKKLTISSVMNTPGLAPFKARGTDFHRGGPVVVNDAPGAHYRELITMPNGRSFIPEGRNVYLPNLPRGSSVLRGDLTSKMLKGVPRFAEGTRKQLVSPIFSNSAVMRTIQTVLAALRQAPNTQGDTQSNQELIEQLMQSNQQQSVMIELLQKLVSKELKIDERALANSVSRQQAREYRLRGGSQT